MPAAGFSALYLKPPVHDWRTCSVRCAYSASVPGTVRRDRTAEGDRARRVGGGSLRRLSRSSARARRASDAQTRRARAPSLPRQHALGGRARAAVQAARRGRRDVPACLSRDGWELTRSQRESRSPWSGHSVGRRQLSSERPLILRTKVPGIPSITSKSRGRMRPCDFSTDRQKSAGVGGTDGESNAAAWGCR